jgi:hypothetical protein
MGVIHNFVIAGSDPPADAAGIYTAQTDLEPVRVAGHRVSSACAPIGAASHAVGETG